MPTAWMRACRRIEDEREVRDSWSADAVKTPILNVLIRNATFVKTTKDWMSLNIVACRPKPTMSDGAYIARGT